MTDEIVYNTKECPLNPGYYIVAGYTRYAINVHGRLIERITSCSKQWSITKGYAKKNIRGGYHRTRIKSDLGVSRSVSRHRTLALTFKHLPNGYRRLTVNHKNGKPGEDELDNLEWCTYSQNTKHAYRAGLYPNKVRKVDVFFPDGNVKVFQLRIEAIEASGLREVTVDNRLRHAQGRIGKDGYGFRYHGNATNWYCRVNCARREIPFYLKPLFDGPVLKFSNAYEAADYLTTNVRNVRDAVSRKHPIIGDFQISREPSKSWNVYSEKQVKLLLNTHPSKRNIVL